MGPVIAFLMRLGPVGLWEFVIIAAVVLVILFGLRIFGMRSKRPAKKNLGGRPRDDTRDD